MTIGGPDVASDSDMTGNSDMTGDPDIMTGSVHSILTLGGLDGPGLRVVVFLQGCHLRCAYCHNPDAQATGGGQLMNAADVLQVVQRCRGYLGLEGGITLSGGEPLAQPKFAAQVLRLCREQGIHTALDTSGGVALSPAVQAVLEQTDLLILDIKHTDPQAYRALTGSELSLPLGLLEYASSHQMSTWVRQVIVPGINDSDQQVRALARLVRDMPNVQRVQLLGYHKLASGKYHALGMADPLADVPAMPADRLAQLQATLDAQLAAPISQP